MRTQYDAFLKALPDLKPRYAGRWIVFRDGVQSDHPDERSALRVAIQTYGHEGGFTVVQVVDPEPVFLRAR